jgi:tRNA A-37 threonylcarbamoyl transferase component Bud32
MVELWPRFAPYPGLKIPRPLDLFEQEMALVMEEAPGMPLSKTLPRLGWSSTRLQSAESDCRRIGRWLRVYHQFDAVQENKVFSVNKALSDFDASLGALQKIGCNISGFAKSDALITAVAKRIAGESRPVSKLHGDFKMDNIMITRTTVTVLDISIDSRQITDLDIVAFLNSILMLRLTRPIPWAAIDGMRKNFLEGYFGGLTTSELLIYFLQVLSLAEIALEIAQRRSSHTVNLWIGWSLKSFVAKLIKDMKRLV